MEQPLHFDELGIDHFGTGILGLTRAEAEAIEARGVISEQQPQPGECRHFGALIETRTCEGCGGKGIAVHACALHVECTLQTNRDGVKLCPCPDFRA